MSKLKNKIREMSQETGFSLKEVDEITERYRQLDKSKGSVDGIPIETMLTVPEFVGHPFIADILRVSATGKVVITETPSSRGKSKSTMSTTKKGPNEVVEEENQRILLDDYIRIAWKLSSKANDKVKQELAWRVIDIWQAGVLRQAEMFRVYRLLMKNALTDDHCLDFAQRALTLPQLKTKGEITKEEFFDIVPPYEIRIKFTINLQTKSSL